MPRAKQTARPAAANRGRSAAETTEVSYRFVNADPCSGTGGRSDFLIAFPPKLGSATRRAQLYGSWTALMEPDGDFQILEMHAEISSFSFPYANAKSRQIEWRDAGRLEFALADDPGSAPDLVKQCGSLNRGRIDLETGYASVTWGLQAHSPELRALKIDPLPLLIKEVGFLSTDRSNLYLAGSGIVTSGACHGTILLCSTPSRATCNLRVSIPGDIPQNAAVAVTVRYTETPPSAVPVTFDLSATVKPFGAATVTPATVTITAPGTATAVLTVTGSRANNNVVVTARGGGQTDCDRGRTI